MQFANAQITATLTTNNISCFGVQDGSISATATGGTPPYTYEWSNQETGQTITGLAAGYYRITVKDDFGALGYAEVTLTEPEILNSEPDINAYGNSYNINCYNCFNGSIIINIDGGTAPCAHLWNDGNTNKNRVDLAPGNHDVTITDSRSCVEQSKSMYLNQPDRNDWSMIGNSSSNPLTNFIGTTDNKDLKFLTNNLERLSLDANGDIKMSSLKSDSTTNKYRYVTIDDNGKLKANYISYCPGTLPPDPLLLGGNIINVTNPQLQYIGSCNWADVVFGTSASERMRLKANGFFGIGVTSPVKFLDVQGSGRFRNYANTTAGTTDIGSEFGYGLLDASNDLRINFYSDKNVIIGQAASKIGIGTSTPIAKLDVFTPATITDKAIAVTNASNTEFLVYGNGQVYAREVTVKTGTFPDYVFAKDYSLLPLNDLAEFIKTNNHLPEMPTATEVEINGQALGAVQTLLVKKVEELTLYLIEQNKRIPALEKNNQQLNEQLKTNQSHK